MAPVLAAEVDPPDRKPATRVDSFYIDRTEVSVREFEQFVAAMGKAKYEDVRRLWPSEKLFTAYRQLPEYLRSGNNDPSWPIEDVNYYQARAYALWREKDIFTLEEWWRAARGPLRGGTHQVTSPNPRESRNPERPVRVDMGGVAVAFPPAYRVHHLSGNVAEWCQADRADATTAPLVGGRYADSSEKKFLGEAPDYTPLDDSRRGYGFRCVLRPADFFEGLVPVARKN
jgi:formylglycine-generating enzyme required for sulfatase activity